MEELWQMNREKKRKRKLYLTSNLWSSRAFPCLDRDFAMNRQHLSHVGLLGHNSSCYTLKYHIG